MTTVAYKAGILAADTRITDDEIIDPAQVRKVFKLKNGLLLGFAGSLALIQDAMRKLKEDPANLKVVTLAGTNGGDDDEDSPEVILVYPNGKVMVLESKGWVETKAPYYAIGSGRTIALVAMRCGKSAVEAVRIAFDFDKNTGGSVQSVRLSKRSK